MSRKKVANILLLIALLALTSAVSWVAGSRIQSPAEAAARTAPPTPSPILVPIELRTLTSFVVTRGTARFGQPQTISIAPSPLKGEPGVISRFPARGSQVHAGDVLLVASGRPVFVLPGPIPIYRDLAPGTFGEDVRQLESGLLELGYDPGPLDGLFDDRTGRAVEDWYRSQGFEPFGLTAAQTARIRELQSELALAQNDLQTALEAASTAELAVDIAKAQAEYELAQASGAERPVLQLAGEFAVQQALDALSQAQRDSRRLAGLVGQLKEDLALADFSPAVQIPSDELYFLPELPVRIESLLADVGDPASGALLVATNNQLAIDSSLPLSEAPLVRAGMPVQVDEPELGIEATGVVNRVAASPGTDGVDGFHIYFEVLVEDASIPLEGFSLRLTIPVESTGGDVPVVPLSALSMTADGSTRIQVEESGGLRYLGVEPGLSAGGFVAVSSPDVVLRAGQMVVIGFEGN